MRLIYITLGCILAVSSVALIAANFTPYLTGGGGTPSNAVVFPISSPAAYLQSSSGALSVNSGGTNQNLNLLPSGSGTVVAGSGGTPTGKLWVYSTANGGQATIAGTSNNVTLGIENDQTAAYQWRWLVGGTSGGNSPNKFVLNNLTGGNTAAMIFDTSNNATFAGNLNLTTGNFQIGGVTVPTTPGMGLSASGATLNSNAAYQITYQPGTASGVLNTKTAYAKVSAASTVDNLIGSATIFVCSVNPVVTFFECGTSATCASPTTIGTVTVTGFGQAFAGTVSSSAITAGDYVSWATTAGSCTSLDIAASAQVHSN